MHRIERCIKDVKYNDGDESIMAIGISNGKVVGDNNATIDYINNIDDRLVRRIDRLLLIMMVIMMMMMIS